MRTPAASVYAHVALLSAALAGTAEAADAGKFPTPLPVETIPAVATLPAHYPDSWVFVSDLHFSSLIDGRVALVDVAASTRSLKGQIRAALFGNLVQSRTRPELYVAETFYSRLTRGDRTDAITIYDTASLKQTGEIVLPGGKKAQSVTLPGTFRTTNDDTLGLVFNFTPAASVTVVDLVQRKVLNEIPLPGCSQVNPIGARGFFSLCGDGGLISIALGADGKIASQASQPKFNDIDNDPAFMIPAVTAAADYFVTFKGRVHVIDVSGEAAKVSATWSLVDDADKQAGIRPSGWQTTTADDQGRLYVLMQTDGQEGSHKEGGETVAVFDPTARKKLQTITLKRDAQSIVVTHGPAPRLVASTEDGQLAVFDAKTGAYQQTLAAEIVENPFALEAAR